MNSVRTLALLLPLLLGGGLHAEELPRAGLYRGLATIVRTATPGVAMEIKTSVRVTARIAADGEILLFGAEPHAGNGTVAIFGKVKLGPSGLLLETDNGETTIYRRGAALEFVQQRVMSDLAFQSAVRIVDTRCKYRLVRVGD